MISYQLFIVTVSFASLTRYYHTANEVAAT